MTDAPFADKLIVTTNADGSVTVAPATSADHVADATADPAAVVITAPPGSPKITEPLTLPASTVAAILPGVTPAGGSTPADSAPASTPADPAPSLADDPADLDPASVFPAGLAVDAALRALDRRVSSLEAAATSTVDHAGPAPVAGSVGDTTTPTADVSTGAGPDAGITTAARR